MKTRNTCGISPGRINRSIGGAASRRTAAGDHLLVPNQPAGDAAVGLGGPTAFGDPPMIYSDMVRLQPGCRGPSGVLRGGPASGAGYPTTGRHGNLGQHRYLGSALPRGGARPEGLRPRRNPGRLPSALIRGRPGLARSARRPSQSASRLPFEGRPVYFTIVGPWTRPVRQQEGRPAEPVARLRLVGSADGQSCGCCGSRAAIAKAERGDRNGAIRLAAFLFAIQTAEFLIGAHHVLHLGIEWSHFVRAASISFSPRA